MNQSLSPRRAKARTLDVPKSPGKSSSKASLRDETQTCSKISLRYEMRGFTEEKVELEHLRTIIKEMDREIKVMESVRSDNKLLR